MIFIVADFEFTESHNSFILISRKGKTSSEIGYEIKTKSVEYNIECDLVFYLNNMADYNELLQYKKLIAPGIIIALQKNAFTNLFEGSFITTVSDFFILTGYDRLKMLVTTKSNDSLTYVMEKNFFLKEILSKETLVYTVTNGKIIYV